MPLTPDWPHCPSCTCRAPVPPSFVSDVRLLPIDLERIARYQVGRSNETRVDEFKALEVVDWRPERRITLNQRINYYRLLLDDGTCGNVREAVRMTAIKRREWEAKQTAVHARRMARRARTTCRDGYVRSLAYKKKLILAEGAPCSYCGQERPETVDHVIPYRRSGDHRRRNLTPACWPCNQEKGGRTPEEWRDARLEVGLSWPPAPRDQALRMFPGTLLRPQAASIVEDL